MKELSVEEKAKRYDKAIEIAKKINNEQQAQPFNVMTRVFPELAESEDERIRKKLIEAVKGDMVVGGTKDKQLAISWLEKQGEKFQYWKPSKEQLEALDYAYNSCSDTERGNYYEGVLETLIDDLRKLSEKQGEQEPAIEMKSAEESLGIDSDTYNKIVDECIYGEQNPAKGTKGNDREIPFSEQEWSEEDEEHYKACLQYFDEVKPDMVYYKDYQWLKSLKDRVGCEASCTTMWKPSEEQMDAILFVVQHYTPKVTDKLAWDSIKILELMYYEIKQ